MNPCEINVLLTAISNQLYASLSKEDFVAVSIFLNELSKVMFSMTLFGGICERARVRAPERVTKGRKNAQESSESD